MRHKLYYTQMSQLVVGGVQIIQQYRKIEVWLCDFQYAKCQSVTANYQSDNRLPQHIGGQRRYISYSVIASEVLRQLEVAERVRRGK